MAKFYPILFSSEMVNAILEGRKTQTRRALKEQPPTTSVFLGITENVESGLEGFYFSDGTKGSMQGFWPGLNESVFCPFGQVGDILWIRETFRPIEQDNGNPRYEYKATEKVSLSDSWKPSIFMPKEACRIFLKIKSIKVDRLQDISEGDSICEGVELFDTNLYKDYNDSRNELRRAKVSFATLWDSINGQNEKINWLADPWVWVIEFERIEKPENFRT